MLTDTRQVQKLYPAWASKPLTQTSQLSFDTREKKNGEGKKVDDKSTHLDKVWGRKRTKERQTQEDA